MNNSFRWICIRLVKLLNFNSISPWASEKARLWLKMMKTEYAFRKFGHKWRICVKTIKLECRIIILLSTWFVSYSYLVFTLCINSILYYYMLFLFVLFINKRVGMQGTPRDFLYIYSKMPRTGHIHIDVAVKGVVISNLDFNLFIFFLFCIKRGGVHFIKIFGIIYQIIVKSLHRKDTSGR